MSELKIESTNGGSGKVKFVGGQSIIDLEQDRTVVPPEASKEATCSNREEDYITMKLVGREQENNQEQGNNQEQENNQEQSGR